MKGIDISHHHPDLDVASIKGQGYEFVILRTSSGITAPQVRAGSSIAGAGPPYSAASLGTSYPPAEGLSRYAARAVSIFTWVSLHPSSMASRCRGLTSWVLLAMRSFPSSARRNASSGVT